MELILF